MRLRSRLAFAVLAVAATLSATGVNAADKAKDVQAKDAPAVSCTGVDMLAETAAKNPQAYERIMAAAKSAKNSDAVLWKVEKDGRPTSYLFGTVHLTDERVTKLSPAVEGALKESKTVALEVSDISEAATSTVIAKSAPLVMFTDGRRLDGLLSPTEYDTVKTIISRSGMPVDLAGLFKPWIVTMILSTSDCERAKVQGGARVLDMKLAEIGKKQGKEVIGLETISSQIEALASVPEQQQIDMLRSSLRFADRTNDMVETLIQLYLKRQISAALPFQIALAKEAGIGDEAFAGFQQKLLFERNAKMRAVAEPLLDKGGAFIAVGALHLPGDLGLVELFRQLGYTVTAVE
jgi:uncharacterized protein YbaP (TraB family)